ncbi:hypothetical protein [Saccharicrinis sp. 156]|uniref:hypothetical protein n=1 Tax=Saccharicrinis sp. 156 TaxID=3417574 RepID=UPI003D344717
MNQEDKDKQFAEYDISNTLTFVTTSESQQKISGHNLVFRATDFGFTVWSQVTPTDITEPFIELDDELELTFLIKLKDSLFFSYTELALENAGNLFFFSNQVPDSEPVSYPLIGRTGDNVAVDDGFVLSDTGATNELERLTVAEKENLFGIIRIVMKGDETAWNVTDATGHIPDPYQSFEILFENRKTTWRYIFDTDQTVTGLDDLETENGNSQILVTKTDQPLTEKGFVSIELGGVELPNPDYRLIKPDSTNDKIYSEIYM